MPYRMDFYVDGGCRRNGYDGAIGAAAAVHRKKWDRKSIWTRALPIYPAPTNQRAEISAIMLALELALEKSETLSTSLNLTIHSDSKYAIACMDNWIYKWCRNGWTNSRGYPVGNRDLIEKASRLDDEVKEIGTVKYIWIPREENYDADAACNRALDQQE
jgi:ribonuclease HI